MPGVGVTKVHPQRAGRLQHPRQAVEGEAKLIHPDADVSLEAELSADAVVAQLVVGRARDHTVDRGVGQLGETVADVADEHLVPDKTAHVVSPMATSISASV